jgi:hypothetical protein
LNECFCIGLWLGAFGAVGGAASSGEEQRRRRRRKLGRTSGMAFVGQKRISNEGGRRLHERRFAISDGYQ